MSGKKWTPEMKMAQSEAMKERYRIRKEVEAKAWTGTSQTVRSEPIVVSEPGPTRAPTLSSESSEVREPNILSEPSGWREPQSLSDPLKELAALIVQAASSDAEDDKVISQFTALLGRIDFKKHPELRDHPAMQHLIEQAFDNEGVMSVASERTPPGTVEGTGLNAHATPWTWDHVKFLHDKEPEGMFKLKTVMCTKTQQVIINGLSVWFPEGQEIRWYAPWVDIYMQSIRSSRDSERHMQWLFKVGPWASNLPVELQPAPHPDWLEDGGLRMRSEGNGMYMPGMGWNPAVDGKRWIPGGGPAPEVEAPPEPATA